MARVLVAEDEGLIRVDIVETLEEGGHAVVGEAGDGEAAILEGLDDVHPDQDLVLGHEHARHPAPSATDLG